MKAPAGRSDAARGRAPAASRPPARAAHAGAVPRVLARAGGGVLGVRLPHPAGRGAWASRFGTGRADVLEDRGGRGPQLADALRARQSRCPSQLLDRAAGEQALRTGRIVLLAVPAADGAVMYRYDDTNPEGAQRAPAGRPRRAARRRRAAIRCRQPNDLVREPGSRYIDFLVPGLLGMNLMGSGIWGIGFAIVDARRKKLLKRLIATPMPRSAVPAVVSACRG